MQEWRIGESARLLQLVPGFDSWGRRHMWVELVVGSRRCSEGFLRVLRFSSFHKEEYSKFPLDPKMRATGLSALLLSVTLTK